MKLESLYSIDDEVTFLFSSIKIRMTGKVIGITFTKTGIFYDVQTSDGAVVKALDETTIQ